MGGNAWRDTVERTQTIIEQQPERCFVCGEAVPPDCPDCLLQAYLDAGRRQRLAVVCGRRACRLALQDGANGIWRRLFDALTHWPDPAIHPHGPYWAIRRPHQLSFRTDPRRTTAADAWSADDPDDAATLPKAEHRPAPVRPSGQSGRQGAGRGERPRRRQPR